MSGAPAYSYIRFSSEPQRLGDSQRRQLAMAKAYAQEHGLVLNESSYQDLGVSAFDRSNEGAALGAFLAAVKNGRVPPGAFLLVENFDRLSRAGIFVTLDLLRQLADADISVVILSENRVYDKTNKDDTLNILIAVIFAARAHDESLQKSRRVRAARQERRDELRQGKAGTKIMNSSGPGWLRPNADKTGFEPIPEKVESVRRVFRAMLTGRGRMSIARQANEEGWPVPGRGTTWHGSLVIKIIKNHAVLGEYQPLIHRGGKRIPEGNPIPGYYPAIIPERTFYQAQAVLDQHRQLPRRRDSGYYNVFQGALKCGVCGANMAWKNKASKLKGPKYAIYMCNDRVRGVTKCPSLPIRKNGVRFELSLMAALYEMHFGRVDAQGAVATLRQERTALEAQLTSTQEGLDRIADALQQTASSPTLTNRLIKLEADAQSLRVKIQDITARIEREESIGAWDEKEQKKALEEFARVLDDPNEAEFRAELRDRILTAVEAIYVFVAEGVAGVVWRGEQGEGRHLQYVILRPGESIPLGKVGDEGWCKPPPARKPRALVNPKPRPPGRQRG